MPRSFDRLSPYIGQALGLSEQALAAAYRPALRSDLAAILDFRRAVNGDVWWNDREYVEWRYFSRTTDAGEAPYWVFVHDGEILGACGLEPVTLVADGQPMSAVRTFDIMVRPDLDGLGLGVFMNLVLFKYFPITMVTGSNARSHHLLTRMFRHTVDLQFWKKAIRASAVIDEKIHVWPLAAAVGFAADLLLGFRKFRRRLPVPAGVSIREIPGFDAGMEMLTRRCEVPGRLLVRRSDAYLNWRFVQNPRLEHRIFGAFDGNNLIGYVITRFNLARPNPRREAEIVDWLAAPATGITVPVLVPLLEAAVERLTERGAGIVTCAAASGDLAPAMEATGFTFRDGQRIPFFIRAADDAIQQRLSAGGDWFLTRADLDVE